VRDAVQAPRRRTDVLDVDHVRRWRPCARSGASRAPRSRLAP
jgi:hypothetical protein